MQTPSGKHRQRKGIASISTRMPLDNTYSWGASGDLRDGVFGAAYRLTRYRFWREEFAPGLA